MRVVIVGGAGFIGSAVARSLRKANFEPLVLDTGSRLASSQVALAGIACSPFDFTSDRNVEQMLRGADALVHLACTSNPAHSMQGIAWDAETNIAPSLRLFDAAVAAGVGRVVFASSGGTVYGAPNSLPVTESHPTRPLSAYGVSKLAIENYLSLYSDLAGVSLRIANPYGAYQLSGVTVGVIARYLSAVCNGGAIEVWGDGSVVRDYIAIDDVVSAFHAALTTPTLAPGAYNIGSGHGFSVNEIIKQVFRVSKKAVPVTYSRGRSYDVPAIVLDSTLFRSRTGWSTEIPMEAGIADLYRFAMLAGES